MHKNTLSLFLLICFAVLPPSGAGASPQQMGDVFSEHLLLRLPKERVLLGRETITELERFYQFLNRALSVKLPGRILMLVDWDLPVSSVHYREGSITVGMNQPAASSPRSFLLEESMRELARFGLLELSRGADRPEYTFLYEGMIEMLVKEFSHTTRSLESAWVLARFLDEMGRLGLEAQRSWADFSQNRRSFRNAAPGITLLVTIRDLKGRDTPGKIFEALKRANLSRSLQDVCKADAAEVESLWLEAVRGRRVPDSITIATDQEAPQLDETVRVPEQVQAGERLKLRFLFRKSSGIVLPEGVFVRDERTGNLHAAEADSGYISGTIPVEAGVAPGEYGYIVTAIDESGNLRSWKGSYRVGPR